jgi:hypothetical protein
MRRVSQLCAWFGTHRFGGRNTNFSLQSLWAIWTSAHAASEIQTEGIGAKEEKKEMARRKLTVEEQLKGVRAALRSKRTPVQLRRGLHDRAEWLERQIAKRNRRKGA